MTYDILERWNTLKLQEWYRNVAKMRSKVSMEKMLKMKIMKALDNLL
jgi:hypothetical protein